MSPAAKASDSPISSLISMQLFHVRCSDAALRFLNTPLYHGLRCLADPLCQFWIDFDLATDALDVIVRPVSVAHPRRA
jgi:hypothetical protein